MVHSMLQTGLDLLPQRGEQIPYIGNRFNLTHGNYYKVIRFDYSTLLNLFVCVVDDEGIEEWVELNEFNLIE